MLYWAALSGTPQHTQKGDLEGLWKNELFEAGFGAESGMKPEDKCV